MADFRLNLPVFTAPPQQYSQMYFADLIRALARMGDVLRSPGEGRQTTIVLTNLAHNDVGLEPGTLFEIDGVLYVSVLYKSFVAGTSATGAVGTVAVTT
jgi:hypothetical protein